MSELIKHEAQEPCMLSIIESAVLAKDVDVEKLEKMLQLKRTYDAEKARTSYFSAMCSFQNEMPAVKQMQAGYGYDYAPLCDVTKVANPFLFKNSLSYRFEQKKEGEDVTIICVITHKDGHSECTSMTSELLSSPVSKSGAESMNALQRLGATVTYLKRYTLCSILGITTADKDVDGRVTVPECSISIEQLDELEELIKPFADQRERFLDMLSIETLADLPVVRFDQAKRSLIKKRQSA